MLENTANNIRVSKRMEYLQSHQVSDQAYEFGLRWVAGSKN
jgi:tellurite resistance protein TerA